MRLLILPIRTGLVIASAILCFSATDGCAQITDDQQPPAADTDNTDQPLPADVQLVAHILQLPVRFQSFRHPTLYVRAKDFAATLGLLESETEYAESQFRLVPGLAGQGVSFESVAHPGYFLRHQNLQLKLHKRSETDAFSEAATFIPKPGLAHSAALSFESVNFPDFFIRSREFQMVLSSGLSEQFKEEATFISVPVFAP